MTTGNRLTWIVRRSPLLKWIASRSIVPAVLLIVTFNQWNSGIMQIHSLDSLSSKATATVLDVEGYNIIEDRINHQKTYGSIYTDIRYNAGSRIVESSITPAVLQRLPRTGQYLPVRYDPTHPKNVAYAGASGDDNYPDGTTELGFALLTLILVTAIFIFYFCRLARINHTANSSPEIAYETAIGTGYTDPPAVFSATLSALQATATLLGGDFKSPSSSSVEKTTKERYQRVRLHGNPGMPDLEWRLLPRQPRVPHTIFIYGRVGYRRWLVIRLPDGRYLWPASRTEPVIGTEMLNVSEGSLKDTVSAQRQLLAAYSRVLKGTKQLPFMIHIPPGDGARARWYTGVPRPVARSFIEKHISAHARSLADAFIMNSVGNPDNRTNRRKVLAEAGQECSNLAGTLRPRTRIWDKISLLLGLVIPFVAIPHFQLSILRKEQPAIFIVAGLSVLFFGLLPTLVYIRSVRYARRVFRPNIYDNIGFYDTSVSSPTPKADDTDTLKSISYLERSLFREMSIRRPEYWLMRTWVSWALLGIYIAGILSLAREYYSGNAVGWTALVCGIGIVFLNAGRILEWLGALRKHFLRP